MNIINFEKILSASKGFFGYAKRIIPFYKEVKPTIINVKKTYDSYKSIKSAAKEASFREIKSFERPKKIYDKKNNNRYDDGLTLFYEKKN